HRTEVRTRRGHVLDRAVDRRDAGERAAGGEGRLGQRRAREGGELGDAAGAGGADRGAEVGSGRGDGLGVVRAHLEGERLRTEHGGAVELRLLDDVLDFQTDLGDLGRDRVLVVRAEGAV